MIIFFKKTFLKKFGLQYILIMNIGIGSIDFNFNLSAVNDYENCFKIVTEKINFQVLTNNLSMEAPNNKSNW